MRTSPDDRSQVPHVMLQYKTHHVRRPSGWLLRLLAEVLVAHACLPDGHAHLHHPSPNPLSAKFHRQVAAPRRYSES